MRNIAPVANFLLVSLLLLFAPDPGQADAARVARIQEEQQRVAALKLGVADRIAETRSLIENYMNGRVNDEEAMISGIYDAIEADTKSVLASISLNSDFRDALDEMRGEIDTLIGRNMREPQSARRDSRLQTLQELKIAYQQQYDAIGAMENRLTQQLVHLNEEKKQTMLDAGVNAVERVVSALSAVVGNLEALEGELGAVADAVYQDASFAQN